MGKREISKMILTVFIALSFAFLTVFSQASAQKHTLKAVSAWPKTVYEVQNFMKFLDMVEKNVQENCPDELKIRYMGGPEVISNRQQVEALKNGLVDMVFTTVGYYVSSVPVVDGLNLTRLEPWEEREQGVNDFLNKIHQKKINAYYLGHMGTGMPFTLYLNEKISKADLSDLKIRCSPSHIPFLKEMGADPEVIPPPDVYTALERGVVDGYVWVAGLIQDWGWNEVTKYIVQPSFYEAINIVLINHDTWQDLPKHLQKLLIKSQEQAEHYAVNRGQEKIDKEFAALQKQGLEFINLPEAEAQKLRETAYSALWDQVIQKAPKNGPKLKKLISD